MKKVCGKRIDPPSDSRYVIKLNFDQADIDFLFTALTEAIEDDMLFGDAPKGIRKLYNWINYNG